MLEVVCTDLYKLWDILLFYTGCKLSDKFENILYSPILWLILPNLLFFCIYFLLHDCIYNIYYRIFVSIIF